MPYRPMSRRRGIETLSATGDRPREFPDRYESGSPNMVGIAGLDAGVAFLEDHGVVAMGRKKSEFVGFLREELLRIPGVRVYGTDRAEWARRFTALESLQARVGEGAVVCVCPEILPIRKGVVALPVGVL